MCVSDLSSQKGISTAYPHRLTNREIEQDQQLVIALMVLVPLQQLMDTFMILLPVQVQLLMMLEFHTKIMEVHELFI